MIIKYLVLTDKIFLLVGLWFGYSGLRAIVLPIKKVACGTRWMYYICMEVFCMKKEKKRLNIYVEIEKYDRFKRILDAMGITVTDFMDQTMTDFIDNMEEAVMNKDKDVFLNMMARNIDAIQEQVANELKK